MLVAFWPPGFVTSTLTEPLACAGATAVMVVLPSTFIFEAAVPPKVTVAPLAKPVPEMVTVVPPVVGPDVGCKPLIIGAVFGVVVKNSAMFGAVAAAPGNDVNPSASALNRSVL